jgi:hypothetical protein
MLCHRLALGCAASLGFVFFFQQSRKEVAVLQVTYGTALILFGHAVIPLSFMTFSF